MYALLGAADTVGVFQVESRAQMATLPRLRPENFYDLVVEVALIRPGPIQGGSVHPYLRRRNGEEEVTYLHPLLEPCLEKTLGVPLFQEQLMQMAVDVAGFSPGEADRLRQAMGSKRSRARMARMRERLMEGMAANGIVGETAEAIAHKLEAFADFGFPESHSVSFAYLVYSSSWIKLHHPAEFVGRAAQRAADGVLLTAHPRARRPSPRRRGARPRRERVTARLHARAAHRCRGAGGSADARVARRSVGARGARRAPVRPGSELGAARPDRRRTFGAAVRRSRRLHPPHRRARSTRSRRSPRPARSRRASASTAGPGCGPRARCATRAPTSSPGSRSGWRRRRCRG